jgi:hypothetical protein
MVFAIKPELVSSLEQSLHLLIQEAAARASLEAYAVDNLPFIGAMLILQQEIAFDQGKIWRHGKKGLIEMHKNGNLKDGVRIEIN